MESLWNEENNFIGAKFTRKEAFLVHKIFSQLSPNDLERMELDEKEKDLVRKIYLSLD